MYDVQFISSASPRSLVAHQVAETRQGLQPVQSRRGHTVRLPILSHFGQLQQLGNVRNSQSIQSNIVL